MKRGAMTHGSKSHREHGSTGPGTTPGRNFPGLKMAGHMGNVRRKVRSLQVLKVDLERRAIVVRGSVPGKAGNILEIAPAKVRHTHEGGVIALEALARQPARQQQQQNGWLPPGVG